MRIPAIFLEKLLVAAAFRNSPMLEKQDGIHHARYGQPVGNKQAAPILGKGDRIFENLFLAFCIQRGRWLIQDKEIRPMV